MSETAARELYEMIVLMNERFKRGSGVKALEGGKLGLDYAEMIVTLTDLVTDARDEVLRARFPSETRTTNLIDRLNSIQRSVINALTKRGNEGTTGILVDPVVAERMLGIAEQVENAEVDDAKPTSRQDMISQTESLISEVKEWGLDEYATQTLLIQLNNVTRVIQMADSYSSSEVRLRVKSVIADFASEFTQMDKAHQTHLERLILWGRLGFFSGTTLLGLTANTVAITAALPAP